jgi:uncharacterized cofD-like protein
MPAVLRGLRRIVGDRDTTARTAVVTRTDDGGSSGRLRPSRGLPPPGDVRNCLVALSPEEDLLSGLFQHRYEGTEELGGHTVGNLILAALAEQTGSFLKAVEVSAKVLRTTGRILPATLEDVTLVAVLEDGNHVSGETRITASGKGIRRISLRPPDARPTPGVIEAILGADLVVLGPGSLYTSIVPNLLVDGVAEALRTTRAVVVLVGNLVSEQGETDDLDLVDHVEVLEEHSGGQILDAALVHEGPIDEVITERYREEGATPLAWPERGHPRVHVVRRNLLCPGEKLRHDPAATADGLVEVWSRLAATKPLRARA